MAEAQNLSPDTRETLQHLGDEYSVSIVSATLDEEKSVKELSNELGIPIATVYRRVEDLVDAGFLEYEGKKFKNGGKRVKVYRSYLDEINILFGPGEPKIEIKKESDARRAIDSMWGRME